LDVRENLSSLFAMDNPRTVRRLLRATPYQFKSGKISKKMLSKWVASQDFERRKGIYTYAITRKRVILKLNTQAKKQGKIETLKYYISNFSNQHNMPLNSSLNLYKSMINFYALNLLTYKTILQKHVGSQFHVLLGI